MPRKLDMARRNELAARAVAALRTLGGHCTMSELAAALGVKRPTLYFYFPDLTSILEVALADVQRRYLEHVMKRTEGVDHPLDQIAALARATAEFQSGQRDLVVLLFQLWAAGGSDPERVIEKNRASIEPLRLAIATRLADGIERGQVIAHDPVKVVDLVMATLDGGLVALVTRRAPPQPIVDEMIERVLEPLRRRQRHDRRTSAVDRPARR